MYSERLLDHFRNPRYAGRLAEPAITVEVSNPVCGDLLSLSVRLESSVVVEARFKAQGCPPTIACGSALAQWLHARPLEALQALTPTDLAQALDGLPPASMHAAALAVQAVHEILRRAFSGAKSG